MKVVKSKNIEREREGGKEGLGGNTSPTFNFPSLSCLSFTLYLSLQLLDSSKLQFGQDSRFSWFPDFLYSRDT